MQPAVHFVLSLAIGALLLRRQSMGARWAVAMAVIGTLPDLDHIIVPGGYPSAWLHSGPFLVFAPLMFAMSAFVFDSATPERGWKAVPFGMAVLAVLSGHLALDIAAGNTLPLAMPFEQGLFHAEKSLLLDAEGRVLVMAGDVALACWGLFIAFAYVLSERPTIAWADESEAPAAKAFAAPPLRVSMARRVTDGRARPDALASWR